MAKKRLTEEELPSNSMSSRVAPIRPEHRIIEEGANIVEPKRVRKSIEGHAIRKKRTLSQSIAKSFFNEDTKNVGAYVINDVLVPAAKNLIQEMITSSIEMLLFGETRGSSRSRGKDKDRSTVSYGSFYKNRDDDRGESRRRPASRRDKFDLSDIFFRYGDDADNVLRDLCDLAEDYEQVTVSDYFDLAGIDGATWAHTKFGWEGKDLRKAFCTHTREGYTIVLPDPIELD